MAILGMFLIVAGVFVAQVAGSLTIVAILAWFLSLIGIIDSVPFSYVIWTFLTSMGGALVAALGVPLVSLGEL